MMRTWTFGQKLAAGFALVVLMTLMTASLGLYALREVVEGKDLVIQHTGQNLIDAESLRAAMQRGVANDRTLLLTGDPRYEEGRRDASREFAEAIARIRDRGVTPEVGRLLAAIDAAEEAHRGESDRLGSRRSKEDDLTLLAEDFERLVIPKWDALAASVRALVTECEREREERRKQASETASTAMAALIGVALGTLLLALLIAWLLTRALSRQIGSSVQHIRSSSSELQAVATQQASGATEQATAMNEISTTIGELLATSRQIAHSGQHVAKMASDSARSAREGEQAVGKAHDAVASIKQQVDTIVQHMLDLGKKSQQIGGILEIINELAEQTNILAINATIEAAGAGESGRRFAVVGEEIRKLADRVGGSTKEIRSLIEDVRAAVNATVMATETGSKTVDAGTQRFQELQSSFSSIGSIVASTMEAGKEIELSTKQQSTAVEQVNVAISNVAQATKETEASSQQTLQTASELTSLSDQLTRLVQARRA
jgi:CHASE3 domain sensor protein